MKIYNRFEESENNPNNDSEYAVKVLSSVLAVSAEDSKRVIKECEKCGCDISAFSYSPEKTIFCTISVNRVKYKIGDNTYAEYSVRTDNIVERMIDGHRYLLVFDAPILLLLASLLKESSIGTIVGKVAESISTSSMGITGEALVSFSQTLVLSFSITLISFLKQQKKRVDNEEMCVLIVILSDKHLREQKFSNDELFEEFKKFKGHDNCCYQIRDWVCDNMTHFRGCLIRQDYLQNILISLVKKHILDFEKGLYSMNPLIIPAID